MNFKPMIRLTGLSLLALMLYGCGASHPDPHHELRTELSSIAGAVIEIYPSQIASKRNWSIDFDDAIQDIQKNELWWGQLSEGQLVATGGLDTWDTKIVIYRRKTKTEDAIVVESAGPDRDLEAKDDNVDYLIYLD